MANKNSKQDRSKSLPVDQAATFVLFLFFWLGLPRIQAVQRLFAGN